jgi:hypothetical protein
MLTVKVKLICDFVFGNLGKVLSYKKTYINQQIDRLISRLVLFIRLLFIEILNGLQCFFIYEIGYLILGFNLILFILFPELCKILLFNKVFKMVKVGLTYIF